MDTAGGSQGAAGGLGVWAGVVQAARSASRGFARFRFLPRATGCSRGERGRPSGAERGERAAPT